MTHFGNALFQWNDHNLMSYSEDFSQWIQTGPPILSSGQSDPFGGSEAWLIEDDNASGQEFVQDWTDANDHNSSGSKTVMVWAKAGNSTRSSVEYTDGSSYKLLVAINWTSGVPSLSFSTGSELWTRSYPNGWYHFGFLTNSALDPASSHVARFLPAQNTTAIGTVYCFGFQVCDVSVAGSYVATNGTAIPYSTTAPAQSHSLQAPLRALRPAVRTQPFVRESLNLAHRQVTTVADPRHETLGTIRYESDQESFHQFLAAAARFPVTYIPSSSDLNDAHECWAIVGDPLDSVMDADRGFPGFEDVSLEIRLRRLDGQPATGIYG